jgi:acyl-CoA thioesterase FadM
MTKWLVLQEHTVGPADREPDGTLRADTVRAWVESARSEYLDQCPLLQTRSREPGLELRVRESSPPAVVALGTPTGVVTTASVTEVRPASFTIAVRLRPGGGDRETPVNVRATVWLEHTATGEAQELGDDIRDELIALEHSARHYN